MCGFLGIIDFDKEINISTAENALKTIIHRGPDSQNNWNDTKNIFLGHNRLSIIDLSEAANQPLFSSHADVAIVFNGEIYNYRQLSQNLGTSFFKTNSDTEVLLEGYIDEGISFFKKLRGIYAFAILDRRNGINLILGRDPSGVKPLYYYKNDQNNKLVFGSEIKAIKPLCAEAFGINKTALYQYLNLSYIPEPQTAYSHIHALSPGHYLQWSPGKSSIEQQFFKFDFENINNYSVNENIEIVRDCITTATTRNLVSDVNVSIALSGGVDSSLLYYYAMKQDDRQLALTVSFNLDETYNEAERSALYSSALKGRHEIIPLTQQLNLELINSIFDHFDQPYADSSAIPSYLLNNKARSYSKVLIGGDGGDELFNGYPSQARLSAFYKWSRFRSLWHSLNKIGRILPGEAGRKLTRISGLIENGNNPFEILYNRNSWFPTSTTFNGKSVFRFDTNIPVVQYSKLFQQETPVKFDNKIVFDYFRKTLLSDYLRKTDMMSMLNGVEYRVPMLDEDLVTFALSIPFHQKSDINHSKKILRKLQHECYPNINKNVPKSGFSIPLDAYLTKENKKIICETLLRAGSVAVELVDKNYIQFLIDEFYEYKSSRYISRMSVYQRILILYNLQRWYDKQ